MPATEVSIRHQPTLARSSTAHTSDSQACSPGSRPITFTGRLSRRRRPTREGDQVLGFDVRFRFGAHAEYVSRPADDLLACQIESRGGGGHPVRGIAGDELPAPSGRAARAQHCRVRRLGIHWAIGRATGAGDRGDGHARLKWRELRFGVGLCRGVMCRLHG